MSQTMPALTIWEPWASLIAEGAKPYEFRRWPAPRAFWGRRIAIHAGARPVKKPEVAELLYRLERNDAFGTGLLCSIAQPLLERALSAPTSLPRSSVLCTAILGEPKRATEIFAEQISDSDRVDHEVWAWPLTAIVPLRPFVPATGAQGFWNWTVPEECAA